MPFQCSGQGNASNGIEPLYKIGMAERPPSQELGILNLVPGTPLIHWVSLEKSLDLSGASSHIIHAVKYFVM